MSTLSVELPDTLYHHAEELAQREGVSLDQFIAMAIEKMAVLLSEDYLEQRARRASRAKYEAALAQVPDVEPEAYDRLPGK